MAVKKRKHGGHAKAHKKAKLSAPALVAERSSETQQSDQEPSPKSQQQDVGNVDMADAEAPAEAVAGGAEEEMDLLSAELRAELGDVESGGALVLPGRKKKSKAKTEELPAEALEAAVKMSKSKRKKMEALAARKVKEARRADLYKSLEQQSLSQSQLQLMYSTSQMGHKETLRERLKRSMNRQKAGLELSAEAQNELVKKTDHPPDMDA
ncbi:hypothetical protein BBJ28_00018659, partial [Nothophytophthora sp. Chile5]